MAITRPDIYEHNNSNYAIVDANNSRGGHHNVANVAARDAIPADKRAIRMLVSFDDTGTNITARYEGADLTDLEWEDNNNWVAVGGSTTAGSGLTQTLQEIKWGGTLSEALTIATAEYQIDYTTPLTNATFELDLHDTIASTKFNFSASEGDLTYNITGTPTNVELKHITDASNLSFIQVAPASILLRTRTAGANIDITLGAAGLDYAADYATANAANDRWIVDKGYVDAAITAGDFTFSNGLTEAVGAVVLGGALTGNTDITTTGFTYDITANNGYIQVADDSVTISGDGSNTLSFVGANVTMTSTGAGLVYAGNYSGAYGDRSLVDKAYVVSLIPAAITASGGLTRTVNDIALGGTLATGETIIEASGDDTIDFSIVIEDTASTTHEIIIGAAQGGSAISSSLAGGDTGSLEVTPTYAALGFTDSATGVELNLSTGSGLITGEAAGFVGLTYAGNYTGNFVTRSLVDKGYVDGEIIDASFTFSNGITEAAGAVKLGGALTANTYIDVSTFDFVVREDSNWLNYFQFTDTLCEIYHEDGDGDYRDILSTTNSISMENVNGTTGTNTYLQLGQTTLTLYANNGAGNFGQAIFNYTNIELSGNAANFQGAIYLADYAANNAANDRWLPDKAYVDTAAGTGYTFTNGLTEAATIAKLGGALTEDTNIDGAFFIKIGGSTPLTDVEITTTSSVNLDTGGTYIDIQTSGIIIGDPNAEKGMSYLADYSVNNAANDRWVPDKAYIDGAITAALPTDDILDWSTDKYTPYATNADGVFAIEVAYPDNTTRLNYDGYFYATQLFGSELLNIGISGTDYARLEDDQLNILISSTGRTSLTPGVANGGSAIAYTFDTANDLTTAGAKIASFQSAGTEKAYIDKDGTFWADSGGVNKGYYAQDEIYLTFSSTKRTNITPNVVDGASAIGYTFDTVNSLANATAKIASFQNQGSEKVFIDKDGNVTTASEFRLVDSDTYIAVDAGDLTFNDANTGTRTLSQLAASISDYTFSNGINEFGDNVKFGGILTENTTLACNNKTLNITNIFGNYDISIAHTSLNYKVDSAYTTGEVYMELDNADTINLYAKADATTNPNRIKVTTSNIELQSEDGGILITDYNLPGSRNLMKYAADYTGDMTDARVIPDLAKVQSLITSGGLTFNNALTQVGSVVQWGGALVANVEIDGAYNIEIGSTTPIAYYNLIVGDGSTYSEYDAALTYNSFSWGDEIGGTAVTIQLDSTDSALITDTKNEVGAKYAADYSDNFVNRSLVDKGYVDNAIAEAESDTKETEDREIYVDGAAGDDVTGTGDIGTPFQTLEKALSTILSILDAKITVTLLGSNTYTFNQNCVDYLNEFEFRAGFVSIEGEPEILTDSFTAAEAAGLYTYDVSGETWTINEYKGKFIRSLSPKGFDSYEPIYENTTTTFKSWVVSGRKVDEVVDMTTVLEMDADVYFNLISNPTITGHFTMVGNQNKFGKIQFLTMNINYPVLPAGALVENIKTQIIGFGGCLFTKEVAVDSYVQLELGINKGLTGNCIFQGNTDDKDAFKISIAGGSHDSWPIKKNYIYKPGTEFFSNCIFMSGSHSRVITGNIVENYKYAFQVQASVYVFSFSDVVVKDCSNAFRIYGSCQLLFSDTDLVFENVTNFFQDQDPNYVIDLQESNSNTIESLPTNLNTTKPYYIPLIRKVSYPDLYIEVDENAEATFTNNTATEVTIGDKTQNRSISIDYTAVRSTKIEQGTIMIFHDGTTLYVNNNSHDNQSGAGIGMTFDAVFDGVDTDLINLEVTIDDNVDDVTFGYDIKRKMI